MKPNQLMILLLAAACSLFPAFASLAQDPHQGHNEAASTKEAAKSFQTSLSFPADIKPGEVFSADIFIHDSQGKEVENFDNFQEKLMHLIVVDSHLATFQHLHPQYLGKGHFRTEILLPKPGTYFLFCDYLPSGEKEQLSVLEVQAPGATAPEEVLSSEKAEMIVGDTRVAMTLLPQPVKAGENTVVLFDLSHAENLRPVNALQPYLGEKGHLVVIRKSSPLTARDYIHAHATEEGGDSAIQFMTRFPTPGLYKVWCQFKLGGTIQTADFWIQAE